MAKPGDRFFEALKARPVAAGLRRSADVEEALRHGIQVLFILGEDIFALQESVAKAHRQGCLILAHVDLIKGIGRDEAGVRFLAREIQVDGILTTRANLIGPAKREGLIAVQRLFVLDSESRPDRPAPRWVGRPGRGRGLAGGDPAPDRGATPRGGAAARDRRGADSHPGPSGRDPRGGRRRRLHESGGPLGLPCE